MINVACVKYAVYCPTPPHPRNKKKLPKSRRPSTHRLPTTWVVTLVFSDGSGSSVRITAILNHSTTRRPATKKTCSPDSDSAICSMQAETRLITQAVYFSTCKSRFVYSSDCTGLSSSCLDIEGRSIVHHRANISLWLKQALWLSTTARTWKRRRARASSYTPFFSLCYGNPWDKVPLPTCPRKVNWYFVQKKKTGNSSKCRLENIREAN